MIRVSVFYASSPTLKFDLDYYVQKHMPLVQKRLGPALKSMTVEQGISGGAPGAPIPYAIMAHLTFDSFDAYRAAFAPHKAELLGDVPNFSNVDPVFQISEVKL